VPYSAAARAAIIGPTDGPCVHTLQEEKIRALQTECTELHEENEKLRARPTAASTWMEVDYNRLYRLYRKLQVVPLASGEVQAVLFEALCDEEMTQWSASGPTADAAIRAALTARAEERATRAAELRAEAARLEALDPWK
jgi:hypothetical protein